MRRLIDGDALYEKASDLEAQALDYAVKISNDEEKREEWLRWSAILAERTAFKHDVYDAPTIEPEPQWIPCEESLPEMGKRVLICGKKGGIAIARRAKYLEEFDGWTFWMRGGKPMEAIAWMPLPEPYREGEG